MELFTEPKIGQVTLDELFGGSAASGMAQTSFQPTVVGGNWRVGVGSSTFKVSNEGLQLGADEFADAPFSVTPAGVVTMTSATITGYVEDVGGNYASAASGARVLIFPSANIGIQVIDNASNDVFKCLVGGTDVGDVIIGDYSGGEGIKYDKSVGTTTFKGSISASTVTGSTLQTGTSGYNINISSNDLELRTGSTVIGKLEGYDALAQSIFHTNVLKIYGDTEQALSGATLTLSSFSEFDGTIRISCSTVLGLNGTAVYSLDHLHVRDGHSLYVRNSDDTKYVRIYHDGSNGIISNNSGYLILDGSSSILCNDSFYVREGHSLYTQSAGNDKNVRIWHDDADGKILCSSSTLTLDAGNYIFSLEHFYVRGGHSLYVMDSTNVDWVRIWHSGTNGHINCGGGTTLWFNMNLSPEATRDIGDSTHRWRYAYFSSFTIGAGGFEPTSANTKDIGGSTNYCKDIHYKSLVAHTPEVLETGLDILKAIEKDDSNILIHSTLPDELAFKDEEDNKVGLLTDSLVMATRAAILELEERIIELER